MINGMDKLDIYNNSAIILEKKAPKSIISWITILIILLVSLLIISLIKFNLYKSLTGVIYIDKDSTYFMSELSDIDFPVYKDKKLYIKGNKYNYDIVSIKDGILKLKIDLDNSLNVNGNIISVNILIDRTSLFNLIKNEVKKGFEI